MDSRQKLITLMQIGIQQKDYSRLKQADELDEVLGGVLTLKDFKMLFDPILLADRKQKMYREIQTLWEQLQREWEASVHEGMNTYSKTGKWKDQFSWFRHWTDYVDKELGDIAWMPDSIAHYSSMIQGEELW